MSSMPKVLEGGRRRKKNCPLDKEPFLLLLFSFSAFTGPSCFQALQGEGSLGGWREEKGEKENKVPEGKGEREREGELASRRRLSKC